MFHLQELPDNGGEQLHLAIERELKKRAGAGGERPREKSPPKEADPPDIRLQQLQELVQRQVQLELQMEKLRDGVAAAKAASDESRSQRVLATVGTAFLLAPLFFLAAWLLAMVLQRATGGGGIRESMLLACLICAVMGLLLLVLSQRVSGDPLKHLLYWLSDD